MDPRQARALWHRFETIHAVTYFAEEARAANKAVGLRGFWMGYFGSRAAPLGPVAAPAVTATFFNFHPAMVARAIPDTWRFAAPEAILEARVDAAARALRRVAPSIDAVAAATAGPLRAIIHAASAGGRPLFEANRAIPTPQDHVEALWQATTCLREHRGDGHVAALVNAGLDGCGAHVLAAAATGIPVETLRNNRGWSEEEWLTAARRLRERGWIDSEGAITDEGAAVRAGIERTTDRLAAEPLDALDEAERLALFEQLDHAAQEIRGSGVIPFPNPMGLPAEWHAWPTG